MSLAYDDGSQGLKFDKQKMIKHLPVPAIHFVLQLGIFMLKAAGVGKWHQVTLLETTQPLWVCLLSP